MVRQNDAPEYIQYASADELAALQVAREEALAEHANDGCEICESEWFRNIDYRTVKLQVVTDDNRAEIRSMLGLN